MEQDHILHAIIPIRDHARDRPLAEGHSKNKDQDRG